MDIEPAKAGRRYYWIHAEYGGKTLLIKPKGDAILSYEGASRYGFEKLNCSFDIISLPTRNTGEASRMVKGNALDQTSNIEKAIERYSHTEF